MSHRTRVSNLKPVLVSFNTVTTSATAGTYVQLPSVICDEVVFTRTPTTNSVPVTAAFSSSPTAGDIFYVATSTICPVVVPVGPTRNANALYLTNESGTNALVISFMCLSYDNDIVGVPSITRGTAG